LSRAVEQSQHGGDHRSQGSIEYANPQFTRLTGYTLDEVRGQSSRILKSGETPPEEYQRLWKAITSGGDGPASSITGRRTASCIGIGPDLAHQECERAVTHFWPSRKTSLRANRPRLPNVSSALAQALSDSAAVLNRVDLQEVLEAILATPGWVVPHDAAHIMLIEAGIARVAGRVGTPSGVWKRPSGGALPGDPFAGDQAPDRNAAALNRQRCGVTITGRTSP
jgi:hypothetical protein